MLVGPSGEMFRNGVMPMVRLTFVFQKARHYICPTADFLHCYLELFDRPSFQACFQDGLDNATSISSTASGVASRQTEERGDCCLLLLHSELSKLTGAAGALSIRQERRLVQVTR